jgi:hypothetical protein
MKPRRSWIRIPILCTLTLSVSLLTFRAKADQWDKRTILTIDQPMQITDTYLDPGTYVLKLADSSSDRHIVQIFNADQTHIINTVLAIPNYRLHPTGNSQFAFWETPPGAAQALRAWFYPGDNFGQEFRYPKNLRQLAVLRTPAAPPREPVAAPPEPTPAPQAVNQEPSNQEPPVIAQNTAPPSPPVVETAPAPASAAPPQELPKTASPYPLIGLCGLLSLGLHSLVRLTRSA